MQREEIYAALPGALLPWYASHARDLPWRRDREPYHVWLSEIMLQQTRVEAVRGYYLRFLDAFPTLRDLAAADEARLLKLWEGLGYYSRARNLQKAARVLCDEYGGVFPDTREALEGLPGVGPYTAGAVASICFERPCAAVDGNVLRVLSRLTADGAPVDLPATRADIAARLEAVYPAGACGAFTQALMELGATVCGPNRKPECGSCPCRKICLGYQHGTAEALPVKSPKRERRQEDRTVFILQCDEKYALEKRPGKGLLAGLWQFPNVAGHLDTAHALAEVERMGLRPREILREVSRKHIFTHIQWNMKGIYLEVAEVSGGFSWFTAEQIDAQAALPTAFRLFWEEKERDV